MINIFEIVSTDKRKTRAKKLIIGMDEAGRGPVIGPLVIGLCMASRSQINALKKIGVMDSKVLKAEVREELFGKIIETVTGYGILSISANNIDTLRSNGTSLNEIEVMGFRQLLSQFDLDDDMELQLDAADVNAERFGSNFSDLIGNVDSRHKGDSIFPTVSAASILAKVVRDRKIREINEQMREFDAELPKVGSGYPNHVSKSFLRSYYSKYSEFPDVVRTSWGTAINIRKEFESEKPGLDEFF